MSVANYFVRNFPDYILYSGSGAGGPYFMRNGQTGKVDYSGSDATAVIQPAIDLLPDGGLVFARPGVYTLASEVLYTGSLATGSSWAPGRKLIFRGSGMYNTIFKVASGSSGFHFRNSASVDIGDFTIHLLANSVHGIYATSDGADAEQGLTMSVLENMRIYGQGSSASWCMYIQNPCYINLRGMLHLTTEGEGCIRFVGGSTDAYQWGDSRAEGFIKLALNSNNSVGLYCEGDSKQCTLIRWDAATHIGMIGGRTGTVGLKLAYCYNSIFEGLQFEDVTTGMYISGSDRCRVDGVPYTNILDGGTFAYVDVSCSNIKINNVERLYIGSGSTVIVLNDDVTSQDNKTSCHNWVIDKDTNGTATLQEQWGITDRQNWRGDNLPLAIQAGYPSILTLESTGNLTTGSTTYMAWNALQASSATESFRENVMPVEALLRGLRCSLNGSPADGTMYTFNLRKNAGASGISVEISGSGETTNQDTTTTIDVANDDDISLQIVPTLNPTSRRLRASIIYERF